MHKKILILLLIAFLTACSGSKEVIKPVVVKDFVIVDPDPVPPLTLDKPEWKVWNTKQLAENATKPENADSVFYVLSQTEFSILMDNLVEISDRISKYKVNILYYDKRIKEYRQSKGEK